MLGVLNKPVTLLLGFVSLAGFRCLPLPDSGIHLVAKSSSLAYEVVLTLLPEVRAFVSADSH